MYLLQILQYKYTIYADYLCNTFFQSAMVFWENAKNRIGLSNPSLLSLSLSRILIFKIIYTRILTTSIMWWRDSPKTTTRGLDEFLAGLTPASYPSSKYFVSLYSCSSHTPEQIKNKLNFCEITLLNLNINWNL